MSERRWEIPIGYWSWREGDQTVRVTIGAHCIDLGWPWWKPWRPWDRPFEQLCFIFEP